MSIDVRAVTMMGMPNWCEVDVVVSGRGADVDAFESMLRSRAGSDGTVSILATFLPRPEELNDTVSPNRPPHAESAISNATLEERQKMLEENEAWKRRCEKLVEAYGYDNWYDWSYGEWGIKWSDQTTIIERRARSLRLGAECPWGAPCPGLEKVSTMFPNLRFSARWFEAGMGFSGKAAWIGGVVLYYEQGEYSGRRGG